jgi:hypothetical protein
VLKKSWIGGLHRRDRSGREKKADMCVEGEEKVCIDDAGAKESHPENARTDSGPQYDWTGP